MAKEFQEPEESGGSHPGNVIVNDDRAVCINALRLNQMLDDPEKGIERLLTRVDEAYSEDIEASSARNVRIGVRFRGAEVEHHEFGIRKVTSQLVDRP